jgi:hypothetical protein
LSAVLRLQPTSRKHAAASKQTSDFSNRDAFLESGETGLAIKPVDGEKRESDHLKARLGEMLLERELLEQKIAVLEGNGPLARRRSRR